ncbi:hypothetical protein HTZ84_09645 [Haloterrigena sp. SYSU A558-1]|uniref:Uncharacterized protein n=1 Tax=Haloterrigena gelatinilytica TaxID=2741724 RepID=A0ABX2LHH6_9EURY|nr:hypothetical protein [Haloterrigena gelatinilytica]NUC72569.1 hypothetical protein [Haloterrigena gelatinilytica]
MTTVKIASPDGDEVLENVETWTYDKLTLIVDFENGETAEYDRANVIERL